MTVTVLSCARKSKAEADGISTVVRWVISCAPFGILGLVYESVSSGGVEIFSAYGELVMVLVVSMLLVAFVVNPLIVGVVLRHNPYPLILKCIRQSGVTAFFTRSSAANIPVNMDGAAAVAQLYGLSIDQIEYAAEIAKEHNLGFTCDPVEALSSSAARHRRRYPTRIRVHRQGSVVPS